VVALQWLAFNLSPMVMLFFLSRDTRLWHFSVRPEPLLFGLPSALPQAACLGCESTFFVLNNAAAPD
jgi:hypothetical protein